MEAVAPEDAVVGHVQVQSHGVLLRGHHLAVVPLHQVDASDLVAVGEEQVGAFTCSPEEGRALSALHGLEFSHSGSAQADRGESEAGIDGLLVRINYEQAQKESALLMASQISRLLEGREREARQPLLRNPRSQRASYII